MIQYARSSYYYKNMYVLYCSDENEPVIPRGESTQEIIHSREETERKAAAEKMNKEHEEGTVF